MKLTCNGDFGAAQRGDVCERLLKTGHDAKMLRHVLNLIAKHDPHLPADLGAEVSRQRLDRAERASKARSKSKRRRTASASR